MPKVNAPLLAFNRGIISKLALARTDVERTRLSAEDMTNWLPKTQGPMRIRPGTIYMGSSYNDTGAEYIEFVAQTDTGTNLLELTPTRMRIIDGQGEDTGGALITRPTRTTSIGNLTLPADTGGWLDASSNGGTIGFGDTGMVLNANNIGGTAKAKGKIALGTAGDANVEHGLRINIVRGPVIFRAGNDTGDDSYINDTELRTGNHNLSLTPTDTGGIHLQFETTEDVDRIVGSIDFEDTGPVVVTTPWGAADLPNIRYDQSADVVFVAAFGKKQMRIERRGNGRSWSVVDYVPADGPFFITRSSTAKLDPSATFGNITIDSDKNFFKSGHAGTLIRIQHDGQSGVYKLTKADEVSDVWAVTGINDTGAPGERRTTLKITGTWSGTIALQRSFDGEDKGFRDRETFTDSDTGVKTGDGFVDDDPDDNITVYYRLKMNSYTSGTPTATVTYSHGSKDGVARVTQYVSPTSVRAEVLSRFSSTSASEDWAEGRWSDAQAFPSGVSFHEGRLWWFGGTQVYGSVSDDYENWKATTVGDSAPINRTLASGPVDKIQWSVSLLRLFIGTVGNEISLRSTSLDEPLTPTNMAVKPTSTQGGANVRALNVDDRAIFLQRGQKRVFMLAFDATANDYLLQELTLLVPDLLSGVSSMAVQRQPDTRLHFVMDDGSVAIVTYQDQEQVLCWSLWKSTAADGAVEKVAVLPGKIEDQVYYLVRRTINGATKRYLERWATEAQSESDTGESLIMDCAVSRTLSDTGVATGLSHLEAEQTVIWAAKDLSYDDTGGNQQLHTVTSGLVQLGVADTGNGAVTAQIGLPFIKRVTGKEMDATYKSTKLAYAAEAGTALTQPKRVDHLGIVLGKTHNKGLFHGPNGDTGLLDPLPRVLDGRVLNDTGQDKDEVFAVDTEFFPVEFDGDYDTDARIVLTGKAPRLATVMAAIIGMQTTDIV